MTFVARRSASRTSDTWPSWSAPMVGTSAVVAFFALKLSRARRNAGTVRTIMGVSRHLGSVLWVREAARVAAGRRPYQGQCLAAKRAGDSPIQTAIELRPIRVRSGRGRTEGQRTAARWIRFTIERDD